MGIFYFSPNFNLLGREEEILRKKNEEYLLLNFPCDVRKNLRGARFAEDKKTEDNKGEDNKGEDKKAQDNRTKDKKAENKKEVDKEADKLPVGRFSEKHTPSNQNAPQITPSNQDPPPLDEKAASANHKARAAIPEPGLAGQDKARVGGAKQGQGTTTLICVRFCGGTEWRVLWACRIVHMHCFARINGMNYLHIKSVSIICILNNYEKKKAL